MMKRAALIGLFTGLFIFICLLFWQGFTDVLKLLFSSGWSLLWLPVVWLPCLIPLAHSWRLCFITEPVPSLKKALLGIWMGRAVNTLLPVATIGGEIVKARYIALSGGNANAATASVMVDKTIQAFAVVIWGFTGVGLLIYNAADNNLATLTLCGFIILATSVTIFIYIQKAGIFGFVTRLGGSLIKTETWDGISRNARDVDEIIKQIYRDRKRVYLATVIKTLGYALHTSEVWLACYLLGYPITLMEAVMLKSLTSTISDIAFIIPNAYGIQEGAYIMIGNLMGINAELALAISLAVRIREVIIDPAGLLLWHQIETRHLLKRRVAD